MRPFLQLATQILLLVLLLVCLTALYMERSDLGDARARLLALEQKLFFTDQTAGIELSRHQAKRGAAKFAAPVGPSASTNSGTWQLIGGQGVNGSWPKDRFEKSRALAIHDERLFVGLVGPQEGDAQIWAYDGHAWEQIGGNGRNGSWTRGRNANFLISDGRALFAGIGGKDGAAVWKFADSKWSQLGAWPQHTIAYSAALYRGSLYVGMSRTPAVYKYDGVQWEKVFAPSGVCSLVYEIFPHTDGNLYLGTAGVAGCGDVFRLDGRAWKQIGGDGINGSWTNQSFSYVLSFASYQDRLVVALPRLPPIKGDFSSIWSFDGIEWKPITPDNIPVLWTDVHSINSLIQYRGRLLAGAGGGPPGNASIWELGSDGWRQIGGHGASGSWRRLATNGTMEYVYRMTEFKGALIAGFGDGPGVAQVWRLSPPEQ